MQKFVDRDTHRINNTFYCFFRRLCREPLLGSPKDTTSSNAAMSAIVTAFLEGTLGLLLKKGRQSLSEKLIYGDVTNQQLRSWIVSEINDVKSKLESFATCDLKTNVSFLKEGLVLLGKVITTKHGDQSCTETGPDAVEGEAKKPGACLRVTEVTTAGVNILNLAEEMTES